MTAAKTEYDIKHWNGQDKDSKSYNLKLEMNEEFITGMIVAAIIYGDAHYNDIFKISKDGKRLNFSLDGNEIVESHEKKDEIQVILINSEGDGQPIILYGKEDFVDGLRYGMRLMDLPDRWKVQNVDNGIISITGKEYDLIIVDDIQNYNSTIDLGIENENADEDANEDENDEDANEDEE